MTQRNRSDLALLFSDGARPDGEAFSDIFDSCLNKSSDGLNVEGDQTLVLARGLRLGNSADNAAGGLRFNAGQVQFNNGAGWQPIAATAVGFAQFGATTAITYTAGNVGINTATQPTYRFEVILGTTSGPVDQVRIGNGAYCNGLGGLGGSAVVAHRTMAALPNNLNTAYAMRISPAGSLHLNAAGTELLSLRQNDTVRLGVATGGQVVVGGDSILSNPTTHAFYVMGSAFKTDPNGAWAFPSDARLKEEVRDLDAGLAELRRVRPVRYRYNGRGGMRAGLEGVGVLGQEIEEIFPETIEKVPATGATPDEIDDMRVFNPSALTFVLINAVKQLAEKVDKLEASLAAKAQ